MKQQAEIMRTVLIGIVMGLRVKVYRAGLKSFSYFRSSTNTQQLRPFLKSPTVGTYELAAIGIAMAERDLAL